MVGGPLVQKMGSKIKLAIIRIRSITSKKLYVLRSTKNRLRQAKGSANVPKCVYIAEKFRWCIRQKDISREIRVDRPRWISRRIDFGLLGLAYELPRLLPDRSFRTAHYRIRRTTHLGPL